jgi:hypothetical protein
MWVAPNTVSICPAQSEIITLHGACLDSNQQTVTTIDCICADGTVLLPMIIMKGKYVQKSWLINSPLPGDIVWACSPNGWTDNELGVEYIKAFDKWTVDKACIPLQWLEKCLTIIGTLQLRWCMEMFNIAWAWFTSHLWFPRLCSPRTHRCNWVAKSHNRLPATT